MKPAQPEFELEVFLDEEKIQTRVRELGEQITGDYRGRRLHLVSILKGSWMFLADLVRHIDLEVTVDFLGIASYGKGTRSSGVVRITKDLEENIDGLDVLIVEDILDTGETFHYLNDMFAAHGPKSLKTVVLLDKPSRRTRPVNADYIGFTIPDVFAIGYGMDYAQQYRNLPEVRVLRFPQP